MAASNKGESSYMAGKRAVGQVEREVEQEIRPAEPDRPEARFTQTHPAFDCCNDPAIGGGFYQRVQFLMDAKGEVFAVVFERTDRSEAVPQEMRQVTSKANAIASVIRRRLADHADKKMWLHLLCVSSRLGTVGPNADPEAALDNLERLEEMLVQAARPIRQRYIEQLFGIFLLVFVIAFALFAYVAYANTAGLCTGKVTDTITCPNLLNFLMMQTMTVIGIALGVFFSGMVQNRVISLATLTSFDPDGFSSKERHIYVWAVATAAQAMILFKVLTFGIAGQNFADLLKDPLLAILFGFVVAVSTELVVTMVAKAATPKEK